MKVYDNKKTKPKKNFPTRGSRGVTSRSQVIKIDKRTGLRFERAIYIYLPPGYEENPEKYYPLLFMHDGQNCFEAFSEDSHIGSWNADETADLLIQRGRVREFIIVAVSNGQKDRLAEYLPPYVTFRERRRKSREKEENHNESESYEKPKIVKGRADQLFLYYRDEVMPLVRNFYRILTDRKHIATCGSSLGGVFTTYIAWEYPEFACHHAAMSPSYGLMQDRNKSIKLINKMHKGKPRDIRLWLDSGTQDSPGHGDDGLQFTIKARDALIKNGYEQGKNLNFYLDEGATHHESAWAKRLPFVFEFLFPPQEEG
jgi:predicted alpha/beta superfamily hydrolase